jgi:hypothetical protein
MADLSDVLTALAASAVAAIYPNGTGQASPTGAAVKVYAGWPAPAQLDADLRAVSPVCHVSIYPTVGERNTTRYSPNDWKPASVQTPTMTAVLSGQVLTLGGTIPGAGNPHNVVVIANGKPYVYAVLTSDTLASAASALAALIAVDIPGTVSAGAVLTLPTSARVLAARVGVTGTAVRELRRQERRFQFAVWADTPAHRDAIAAVLDWNLASSAFITLADGTAGRIRYAGSAVSDALQKDCLFRRDLFYTVEYGTTQTETETQITQDQLNTSAAPAGITPYSAAITVYG